MELSLISLTLFRRWSLFAIVSVVLIATLIKWQSTLLPTNVQIPAPPVPNPNAETYFERALTQFDPALNKLAESESYSSGGLKAPANGALDHMVNSSRPAFRTLEEGLQYRYGDTISSHEYTQLVYTKIDLYRRLALACQIAANARAGHSDWVRAVHYALDALNLGAHLQEQSPLLTTSTGEQCEDMGRSTIYSLLKHLDSANLRIDANQLGLIESEKAPFYKIIEQEKWSTQDSLLDAFDFPDWRGKVFLGEIDFGSGPDAEYARWKMSIQQKLYSPRTIFDAYSAVTDQDISIAKQPWAAQYKEGSMDNVEPYLSYIAIHDESWQAFNFYKSQSLDSLLEVQMALRAYQLDHHSLPRSLKTLVPGYIHSIPADPFDDNSQLKYRLKNNGSYKIYSVGPDGIDNNGTPVHASWSTEDRYSEYDETSKGDIVAGINS